MALAGIAANPGAELILVERDCCTMTQQPGGEPMSTEETRAILKRAIALGMENYETIADDLHSDDVVNHGPVEDDHGRAAWKRRQAQFVDAFSDIEWTVDAVLADEDYGAVRYTFTGTHTSQLEGIPPTGKRVTVGGMTVMRTSGSKVVEIWANLDRFSLAQQLGLMTGPADA
jgi:predicted ester cyclase